MAPLVSFSHIRPVWAVCSCLFIAISYVAVLYIRRGKLERDHPQTIKRRSFNVAIVTTLCPIFLWIISSTNTTIDSDDNNFTIGEWLGLRAEGIVAASVLPLVLTQIFMAGPLAMNGFIFYKDLFDSELLKVLLSEPIWLRNYVVAPLTEEFVFRACMVPICLPCFGPTATIFMCPLFFGVAHIHHLYDKYDSKQPLLPVVKVTLLQFTYTTVFGVYTTFLFLRTGHIWSCFICHAFCNSLGFPHLSEISRYQQPKRTLLILLHVAGVVAFCWLLFPLTEPSLYSNHVYNYLWQ